MPRPDRPWIRNTYTVSPEVDRVIRERAASLGVDTGTALDVIVWDAMIKPTNEQLKAGGFSEDHLERIFAEDALGLIEGEQEICRLADEHFTLGDTPSLNRRKMRALVKRWRTTRRVDKEHQLELLNALGSGAWAPRILRLGVVDWDWFEPKDEPEHLEILVDTD